MNTNYYIKSVALFAGLALIAGCAGEKSAKKDPFFEKWETMADQSTGHSPAQRKKIISIEEKSLPGPDGVLTPEGKQEAAAKPLPTTPVTLKMRQADIKIVLRTMSILANQNILFKADIKGEVSLDFQDVPWDHAFASVLKLQNLTYNWDGDILRVLTLEDMESEVKFATLKDKKKLQEMEMRRQEPLVTAVIKIDYADTKGIKDNLNEVLTKDKDGKVRGSIRVDEHNNSLVIQASRDDLNKMIPIIETIDKPTSQILIKANIVETTKDTARNLGIQWGGMYKTAAGGQNMWVTPGGSAGTTTADPLAGGYTPAVGAAGIGGQGFGVNFPTALNTNTGGASLGILFGSLGGNILEAQLTALQKDGKVNILSSPSITTLDNQKATTENGEKIPYVTTETSGGTNTRIVKFESAVLKLEITPHVIDGKNLKMKILVQKDEVDMTRQVEGNPFIIKKQTETSLIVQDGETIVISGLTKQRNSDVKTGVPWLKDLPLVGWLFRGSAKSDTMEEVLIFITPKILPPQTIEASSVK